MILSAREICKSFGPRQVLKNVTVNCHKGEVCGLIGPNGAGKTTLLNTLSSFISNDDRIVTIEDAAELQLQQPHVVRLETRPPNIEGKGEVTQRDLVINSLRMRPDRIVVGECRAGEALDMIQAMTTGHDGSLSTGHANTPPDMLRRLETMILMTGYELPMRAIREQIASAVDVIVHTARLRDGSRKITSITEVYGVEDDDILTHEIFKYEQTGVDGNGKIWASEQSSSGTRGAARIDPEDLKDTDSDEDEERHAALFGR